MLPPNPEPLPLEFSTVAQGGSGGPEEAVELVIRDAAAFADFFGGEPPEVEIDWQTEVVTAVALGMRPHTGHQVTIESIMLHTIGIRGGSADVTYREDVAEAGGRALTYPFHAVKSQRFGQASFRMTSLAGLPPALFGDWFGPVEYLPDGVGRYVPREKAPVSRSVAGFIISPDRAFTEVDDAPGDGPIETHGRWDAVPGGVRVELDDGRAFVLELVSVDDSGLSARRTVLA